jgi:hypothetical protein
MAGVVVALDKARRSCSSCVCIEWSLAVLVHEQVDTEGRCGRKRSNYLRPPKTKKQKAYTCLVNRRHRQHQHRQPPSPARSRNESRGNEDNGREHLCVVIYRLRGMVCAASQRVVIPA